MEKLCPHYTLSLVLQVASQPNGIRFTVVSYNGAAELGFGESDMCAVIKNLNSAVFYKSMTSYGDHTVWHDVYRPTYKSIPLYIKITLKETERLLVISFKRR
ncbi:MAG: type II toxin-antitoxin system MqsR family toxin [Desulfuromonadales bacterium]